MVGEPVVGVHVNFFFFVVNMMFSLIGKTGILHVSDIDSVSITSRVKEYIHILIDIIFIDHNHWRFIFVFLVKEKLCLRWVLYSCTLQIG